METTMKFLGPILVTGASGQVGGALVRKLRATGADVLTPGRAELDLSSPESIRAYIAEQKPRWVLNPGAYTMVDKAETEPELAKAINATALGVIGEAAAAIGAPVIHFSTDYVFAGDGANAWTERDATGPLGVYGATKLAGEQALAASGAAYAIFRTSWVYGATGKNFFRTILKLAREKEALRIVGDQVGAPTAAEDLADLALFTVQKAEAAGDRNAALRQFGGIYHACNQGETTWFGFAEEFLRLAQLQEPATRFATLTAIPTAEYATPAVRPLNSRLSCKRLAAELGFLMPPWQASLAKVVDEYERQHGA
jgi:dTDP-4-dehydrorhamnose reductase